MEINADHKREKDINILKVPQPVVGPSLPQLPEGGSHITLVVSTQLGVPTCSSHRPAHAIS